MYLCLLLILPLYQYSSTMSFLEVAEDSDFSYQNLPYGIFSTPSNVRVTVHYYLRNSGEQKISIQIELLKGLSFLLLILLTFCKISVYFTYIPK